MGAGVRQKCRLFLEGREVPFVSATISASVGQPASAIIDLVPEESIKFIRPKTQVHIFVKDSFNFGDLDYYLAFEGEVTGRQMGKSDSSRYFRVTAVDYSGYWDEARTYFMNHNFLQGMIGQVQTGAPSGETIAKAAGADTSRGAATVISQMIQTMLKGNNKDLVEGVIRVFKSMNEINLMYRTAWDRLRMNDRVRAFGSGRIATFLKDLQIEEFLRSYTGANGGLSSLREVLVGIMGLIFHDFVSIPFPSVVSIMDKTGLLEIGKTIGSFLFIPDGYSLPPPRCNVIFPSRIQSIDFVEDFRAAPTRFAFQASFPETGQQLPVLTYETQYYPQSFSDYMFRTKRETLTERASLLGASTLLGTDKSSYGSIFYGDRKFKAVGEKSISPKLRQNDFLTNEESIRGIFLDRELFAPGMTALMKNTTVGARKAFTQEIGKYLFYKKRFGSRNAQAQLMFSPFLVPGFNAILVDDSDAGQTLIAKLQSVTHMLSNTGCATTVGLGYARDFDEVDALSGGVGDPPLPKWFDESRFGKTDETAFKEETKYLLEKRAITTQEAEKREALKGSICFTKLSAFYQSLVGCDSITSVDGKDEPGFKDTKLCTTRGAAFFLIAQYKAKVSDHKARDAFVQKLNKRRIPTLFETFYFLGAQPDMGDTGVSEQPIIPDEFARFVANPYSKFGKRFDGVGYPDEKILAYRRTVIDTYVEALKTKRGFRG